MRNYFYLQAMNNAWANYRLGKACLLLSSAELRQERSGFFPSLIETLNHILTVDWFYVSALEGQSIGLRAFEEDVPYPDIELLVAEQRKIDFRLLSVCENAAEALDGKEIEIRRGEIIQRERFDRTFFHLIQHQIHHRGQAHAMLSGTSVGPPQLDEFYLQWEGDKTSRAPDLIALGMTEESLWPEYHA